MCRVAVNIRHLAAHNCRGIVTSLLRSELPFDTAAKMIWTALSEDVKLATDIFDILLEMGTDHPIKQTMHGTYSADTISLASISALTLMMETHKLETLCRQEFGRLFSHLVVLTAQFV